MTDPRPGSRPDPEALLDALPVGVFAKGADGRIFYHNTAFGALHGKGPRAMVGFTAADIYPPAIAEGIEAFDAAMAAAEAVEPGGGADARPVITPGGQVALSASVSLPLEGGAPGRLGVLFPQPEAAGLTPDEALRPRLTAMRAALSGEGTATGSEEERKLREALAHAAERRREAEREALTDRATGLRNSRGIRQDIEEALARSRAQGTVMGIVTLDLDHFKRVNDRYGHKAGDEVLRTVAQRASRMPYVTAVGRTGGDEFVFITERPASETRFPLADMEAGRRYCVQPVTYKGRTMHIGGCAGIARFPQDGDDVETLIEKSDIALLRAKREGRGQVCLYDSALQAEIDRKAQVEERLPAAIKRTAGGAGLTPVFQPIVNAATRGIAGFEVLARWQDEELGAVFPDEFIPIAADCGVLSALDREMRARACRLAAPWLDAGRIDYLSFNVAPADIGTPGFAAEYLDQLAKLAVAPAQTSIEILESAVMEQRDTALANIEQLHEAGVRIALDDFGTGYSNLRALVDLPLDRIKIDRSLVDGLEDQQHMLDLIVLISQLSQLLGVDIVAEGVETRMQGLFVESAGCGYLQGYLLGRPMPAEGAKAWLVEHEAPDGDGFLMTA